MTRCTHCHRRVTRPQYAEGEAYGATCFGRLFPPMPRVGASRGTHRRARRAVVKTESEVDPRQMQLDLTKEFA